MGLGSLCQMLSSMKPIHNLHTERKMVAGHAPDPGSAIGNNTRRRGVEKAVATSHLHQRQGKDIHIAQNSGISEWHCMHLWNDAGAAWVFTHYVANQAHFQFFPAFPTNTDPAAIHTQCLSPAPQPRSRW